MCVTHEEHEGLRELRLVLRGEHHRVAVLVAGSSYKIRCERARRGGICRWTYALAIARIASGEATSRSPAARSASLRASPSVTALFSNCDALQFGNGWLDVGRHLGAEGLPDAPRVARNVVEPHPLGGVEVEYPGDKRYSP